MHLIPVIDLMNGLVVHAVKGDRANYRPIRSSLCAGSRAEDIVAALLEVHAFPVLYIADLDAIQRRGNNFGVIAGIRERHPELALWIDAGTGDATSLGDWLGRGLGRPVIGSETLTDVDLLELAQSRCQPILSLDYRADAFVGPAGLADQPARWPREVIAMTLARVGSNAGPDFATLRQLRDRAPGHDVFAAGGVRNGHDLTDLAQLGVAGVLLASALHNGSLTHSDLSNLSKFR